MSMLIASSQEDLLHKHSKILKQFLNEVDETLKCRSEFLNGLKGHHNNRNIFFNTK